MLDFLIMASPWLQDLLPFRQVVIFKRKGASLSSIMRSKMVLNSCQGECCIIEGL